MIAADPGRWSSEPRHGFYGLRPPPSSGELVIVQARESFGGPCGAGPARMILRFEPVEGGVRLAAVSLRDAHYVFAPGIIGRPHAKCWLDHDLTRDARMRW